MSVHRTIMGDSVDDTFRWVSEYDWILKSNIDGPTNIHIEWIDTVSEIYLNGDSIGNTDNSFVSYNFFIPNSGLLSIVLKSPIKYVEARVGDEIPSECPPWGIPGVQYIRTAQSQFGWDWGPAVPTMGIGLVELNYHDHHVRVDTLRLSENEWQVNVCMEEEMESELFMYDEFGVEIFLGHFFNKYFSFIVYNVSVWWPRGHGAQPLYRISICTPSRGCIVEKIGFRDFFFENNLIVNGKTIEILGSNLIPPSQFRPYSDSLIEEIFYSFLNQSDGMNLIRVWGGGFFGDSKLYDLCDEYGVIVWEELKFAGATYEWEKIWETVQVEIQQNIGQRYNHVSLMIVSGDNEIELMLKQNWFNIDLNVLEKKKFEYDEFSKKLVSFLKSKFPTLIVFPSSPMNDTHYYDFESDCRDLSLFPENASLVSEYGYQSFANSDTFPDINWLNADYRESEFVRNRQHRIGGTEWILMQASLIFEQTFYTVKWLIWVSQILQSICLKSATEFFRRQPTNAGVMYWQLNDVWPTVSWSLIDYARTPKLAYFYVKPSYHQKLYSLYREGDMLKYFGEGSIVRIVSLVTGNEISVNIGKGLDLNDPKNFESCNDGCVASVSETNYILINNKPIRNRFVSLKISIIDSTHFHVTVNIPSPFIFFKCKGGKFEVNSIYLTFYDSPFLVTHTPCEGQLEFSTFWYDQNQGDEIYVKKIE